MANEPLKQTPSDPTLPEVGPCPANVAPLVPPPPLSVTTSETSGQKVPVGSTNTRRLEGVPRPMDTTSIKVTVPSALRQPKDASVANRMSQALPTMAKNPSPVEPLVPKLPPTEPSVPSEAPLVGTLSPTAAPSISAAIEPSAHKTAEKKPSSPTPDHKVEVVASTSSTPPPIQLRVPLPDAEDDARQKAGAGAVPPGVPVVNRPSGATEIEPKPGKSSQMKGETPPSPKPLPAGKTAPKAPPLEFKLETRRRRAVWLRFIFYPLGALVIIALGFLAYYQLRETRLEGQINAPGYQIDPPLLIVSDFRREAAALRDEIKARRAPLLQDIQEKEQKLAKVKSDLAGRDERVRTYQDELSSLQKESETSTKDSQARAQAVWEKEGINLDATLQSLQDSFAARVVERAKKLQLPYVHNDEYKNPEVWINAYRLALYDAPKTLNAVVEREWAENELANWNKASKEIEEKRLALKTKADDILAEIAPKLAKIQARQDELKKLLAEADQQFGPLQTEQAQTENALTDLKKQLEGVVPPYQEQILALPSRYTRRELPLERVGETYQFSWPHLEKESEFPNPLSNYWILIRATRDGAVYWGFVPMSAQPWSQNEFIITDGIFEPVAPYYTPDGP